MRRNDPSPVMISIITIVALIVIGFIGWNILLKLPTPYKMMMPGPIRTRLLPAPDSATLPEVEVSASDANALLGGNSAAGNADEASADDTQVAVVDNGQPTALPTIPVTIDTSVATPTLDPSLATRTPTPAPTIIPTIDPNAPEPAAIEATPAPPLPGYHRIEGIQHHQQDWNNCGPATLAMGLSVFGDVVTQYDTAAFLKPNAEDRNVTPGEMARFANEKTQFAAIDRANGNKDLIRKLVANDFPVILEIGLDPPGEVSYLEWYGHYVLAVGYDDTTQEYWLFDSLIWDVASLADTNSVNGRALAYSDLDIYWPQFNNNYVVLYDPAREAELAALMGSEWDTLSMWQGALETAQTAAANNPDDPFAWFNLGTAYNSLGKHADAVTAYDKARSIGLPWRMLWYQFGPYEAYYQTGRYPDVVLLANTTLQGRPFFEESYFYRGLAQKALGNLPEARRDLQSAVDFNPNFTAAVNALGNIDG